MSVRHRAAVTVLAMGVAGALSGCVTEGRPPRPKPRDVPQQPAGITPDRVLPSSSPVLADTDRNGYVDTLTVTVYLFARGYDLPVSAPGSFEFEMSGQDGEVIETWILDERAVRAGEKRFMPGPGYQFDLKLLDSSGGDKMPAQRAEVRTRFVPAGDAAPIESRSPLTVNLGPAPGGS